jgi:phosphoglycolate phosphatase-like HAD superfamily hydrolase
MREPLMNPPFASSGISRRVLLATLAVAPALSELLLPASAQTQASPLTSWNDGPAKQAILDFVRVTTDAASPSFVPPEERIATFDQDGTLWVEHPMYSQMTFCFDRVPVLVAQKPELKDVEPFKTVLSGNPEAIAKLTMPDLEKIIVSTLTGMTTDEFGAEAKTWLATTKDPRWKRPYTELIYQPILEVMSHLRANGYKTFIVTGFGQDFVRVYSQQIYDIPPEQVVGSALATEYGYDQDGKPILNIVPKVILNNNDAGKPEGIYLMIGRRPYAAFGNSTGDQQMLESGSSSITAARRLVFSAAIKVVPDPPKGSRMRPPRFEQSLMASATRATGLTVGWALRSS